MQSVSIVDTILESAKSQVLFVLDANGNPAILKIRKNVSGDIYRRLQQESLRCVPEIYEIEESDDSVAILEELVTGLTVRQALEQKKIKSVKDVLDILIKICECMRLLHNCQPPIIYRDLKPENILITDDRSVKLIDFDAARDYKEDSNHDTVMLGTRQYAAPEQYGFSQTDIRTDVYSFGIIMKEMADGTGIKGLCRKKLDRLIRKTTMFDPKDRPVNFEIIERNLNTIKEDIRNPVIKIAGYTVLAAALCFFIFVSVRIYLNFKEDNALSGNTQGNTQITQSGTDTELGDSDISQARSDEKQEDNDIVQAGGNSIQIETDNSETGEITPNELQEEEELFSSIDLDYDSEIIQNDAFYVEENGIFKFMGYPDDTDVKIVRIENTYYGKNVTVMARSCLAGRKKLNKVVISVGYSTIEESAFVCNYSLTAVYIPSTVTYIAEDAFYESPNVVIYCIEGSYAQTYAQEQGIECILLDK